LINIICIGKIKEQYLNDLINDYKKRIEKYHKINIVELKERESIEVEADIILKAIHERDFVIACCIEGKHMDSLDLEHTLFDAFLKSGTIDFIIGSSCGLSDKVKNRANLLLSFSDFTIPHGLFRGLLLEQIYRSFKIYNNESYHK